MNYRGIELKDIADTPQLIDPPRRMLVWDSDDGPLKTERVFAIVASPDTDFRVIAESVRYAHCAEIPEEPKRQATNRQLAQWLAQGNGECIQDMTVDCLVQHDFQYHRSLKSEPVDREIRVRRWDDNDWHEPTLEYMGLQG